MTEDVSTTLTGFISYSTWLDYADEIADYDKEMSEKMESAKRDYRIQRRDAPEPVFTDKSDSCSTNDY